MSAAFLQICLLLYLSNPSFITFFSVPFLHTWRVHRADVSRNEHPVRRSLALSTLLCRFPVLVLPFGTHLCRSFPSIIQHITTDVIPPHTSASPSRSRCNSTSAVVQSINLLTFHPAPPQDILLLRPENPDKTPQNSFRLVSYYLAIPTLNFAIAPDAPSVISSCACSFVHVICRIVDVNQLWSQFPPFFFFRIEFIFRAGTKSFGGRRLVLFVFVMELGLLFPCYVVYPFHCSPSTMYWFDESNSIMPYGNLREIS